MRRFVFTWAVRAGCAALSVLPMSHSVRAQEAPMTSVTETLKAPQFYKVAVELRRIAALDSQDKSKEIKDALSMFKSAATSYVAVGGTGGPRYATYSQTLADAFDRR